jgi:hypothetical protein
MSGILPTNGDFHAKFGILYMPQICDMGPTVLMAL